MRLALALAVLLSLLLATSSHAADWSSAGTMATARDFHDATLLDDGKVLVSGGRDSGELRSAELFDPASGSWSSGGTMAGPRGSFTTTVLAGGKVLAVGGWGGVGTTGFLRAVEIYDPASNSWTETASMHGQRGHHAAATLKDGRVLVSGGLGAYGALTASAEVYAPDAAEWVSVHDMAEARFWHTATALPDGRVLVAGGAPSGGGAHASAELYDPATDSWSSAGSMATGRFWHTATALSDGRVLVAGGDNGSGSVNSAEIYDPATGDWSSAESLAGDRSMHAAAALPDGRVLVAGGSSGVSGVGNAKRLASAEIYGDPSAERSSAPTVAIAQRRVGVRRNRTAIRFECEGEPGTSCTGTLTLRPTGGGLRAANSIKKSFDVPAGASRTITVRVPAPTRAQLARRRTATVRAVARCTAGAKAVAKTLTLVRR